jgi:glycosyltransferase involved in cell wall biosynthesis
MIVVDNFSKDNTVKIAKKLGATVYVKGPERASQDNYGVKMAKGKYVFITGCDMVLDPTYIAECVAQCEAHKYDAIYASVRSRVTNYWSKVKAFERDLYIGDNLIESARFFRRDVFLKLGGYDASLVLHADDYDMQKRLNDAGYTTGRIKAVEWHIDEIDSLKITFLKSFYYGMNSYEYMKKFPAYSTKQLFPVRSAYFRNWKMFLEYPGLAIGLVIFKVVQYASATTGLIFAMLNLKKFDSAFHTAIYKKR